ncbi:MAG: TolC family type I secretion outer membrane protein [Acidobacteriota bacterium]
MSAIHPSRVAITAVGIALAIVAARGAADDDAPLVVTPELAVRLAIERHPAVAERRERQTELEGQIAEVRARALPTIDGSATIERVRDPALLNSPNFSDLAGVDATADGTSDPIISRITELFRFDPTPIPVTTYYYGVSVEQTLYSFGKIPTGIRAAEVLRDQRRAELTDAELDAARNALVALYDLALAESRRSVLAAERASRERQVRQARDFLDAGAGTRLQVLQAEAALAGLRPRELAADGEVARARAALNEALGRPALAPVAAAEGLLERAEPGDPPPLEALIEQGRMRPELRALEIERKALGLQARATRAELLPEITFSGSWGIRTIFTSELTNTQFASWDAGIFLRWRLFDGWQTRSRVRQLASQRRQNELRERRRAAEIAREIVSRHADWRQAAQAARAARDAVAQAEEALRVAEEEARWGAATTLEVLEAQRTLTEARFERVQAVHDALVARADLDRLAGRLPVVAAGD